MGRRLERYCWRGEEKQSDCSDKWQCVKKVTELVEKVVIGHEQRRTNNWFDQKCETTVEKGKRATGKIVQREIRLNVNGYKDKQTEAK